MDWIPNYLFCLVPSVCIFIYCVKSKRKSNEIIQNLKTNVDIVFKWKKEGKKVNALTRIKNKK